MNCLEIPVTGIMSSIMLIKIPIYLTVIVVAGALWILYRRGYKEYKKTHIAHAFESTFFWIMIFGINLLLTTIYARVNMIGYVIFTFLMAGICIFLTYALARILYYTIYTEANVISSKDKHEAIKTK